MMERRSSSAGGRKQARGERAREVGERPFVQEGRKREQRKKPVFFAFL